MLSSFTMNLVKSWCLSWCGWFLWGRVCSGMWNILQQEGGQYIVPLILENVVIGASGSYYDGGDIYFPLILQSQKYVSVKKGKCPSQTT